MLRIAGLDHEKKGPPVLSPRCALHVSKSPCFPLPCTTLAGHPTLAVLGQHCALWKHAQRVSWSATLPRSALPSGILEIELESAAAE